MQAMTPRRRGRVDPPPRGAVQRGLRLGLALIALACAACPGEESAVPRRAGGARIVSLSPAISRTLVDFDLADRIVGRSAFCSFLPETTPVAGDLHALNVERLIELDPSVILLQTTTGGGVDPALRGLAERRGWRLASWSGLDGLDDVERLVREIPAAVAGPDEALAAQLAARADAILDAIADSTRVEPADGDREALFAGPVLLLHDVDPLGAFGAGTYLGDVLVRLGGRNAIERPGWAAISAEDLVRLDPPAIVLVLAVPADAAPPPAEAFRRLAGLNLRALRDGRALVLAHPDSLYPSTGVVEVAARFREILRALAGDGAAVEQAP
jgi:ABC-type hemin transport system substrate-binding protein